MILYPERVHGSNHVYYVLFSFRDLSGIIFNFAASEDIMNACKGRKPTCKLQVTAMATG